MPRGWRSRARWRASRRGWLRRERTRWRLRITRALADGVHLDWGSLLDRTRDAGDRAFLDQLRRLAPLRRPVVGTDTVRQDGWTFARAVLTALAGAQTLAALALSGSALWTGEPLHPKSAVQLWICTGFAAASLLLVPAALRDRRATLLLGTFTASASAFAHPLVETAGPLPSMVSLLYRGLYPEVGAAAMLWELALLFPTVLRPARLDRLISRLTAFAWIVGWTLFATNLLLAYLPTMPAAHVLARDHPVNLYWRIFAAAALPAIVLIFVRARRAPAGERRRIAALATVLAAGTGPFLVVGVARSTTTVDLWMRTAEGRAWMDPLVLSPLSLLPLATSILILADNPFSHTGSPPGRRVSGALLPLWTTGRVRRRLPRALDAIRRTRGRTELIEVVETELRHVLRVTTVAMLEPDALAGTALMALLLDSTRPLDLTRHREPFVLLPERERWWIEERQALLAGSIRRADGSCAAVVLIGPAAHGRGFERGGLWFVESLLLAAAAAWPAGNLRTQNDEPAFECGECGRILDGAEGCCPAGVIRPSALPSMVSARYRIHRRLGAGGMGVTYLADDTTLSRRVVLKTLPALRDDRVAQLAVEARVMGALNHPGIATIYDLVIWRRTPILVIEYLDAGTLAERLRGGPLTPSETVHLATGVLDAVEYLHSRGVLHRDIKPANIGLTRSGRPKLLDFGLAAFDDRPAGTREYLPPEALRGASADRFVDLWAVAVTLRTCLRDTGPLTQFLARALASDPKDRFPDASAMRVALENVVLEPPREDRG